MYFTEQTQVGSLKLAGGSLITLVCGLIVSLTVAFMVPNGFIPSLMLLFVFCLAAYNINCVVVGKCTTWAIVLTVLYIIYFLGFLVAYATLDKNTFKKYLKKRS